METTESVEGMKLTELRDALTARGLSTKGIKKDLAARLLEVIQQERAAPGPAPDPAEAAGVAADEAPAPTEPPAQPRTDEEAHAAQVRECTELVQAGLAAMAEVDLIDSEEEEVARWNRCSLHVSDLRFRTQIQI